MTAMSIVFCPRRITFVTSNRNGGRHTVPTDLPLTATDASSRTSPRSRITRPCVDAGIDKVLRYVPAPEKYRTDELRDAALLRCDTDQPQIDDQDEAHDQHLRPQSTMPTQMRSDVTAMP